VVHDEWQEHRLNFSNFARSLYSKDMLAVGESAAKDILQAVLAGGAMVSFASVGAGLIVGVVWYAAKRAGHVVDEARKSPYRWLSRIHKAGAHFQHSPLWECRVAVPPDDAADPARRDGFR
jgi:hypothetical protein